MLDEKRDVGLFGPGNEGHDTDCDCKECLIDTWHAEVSEWRAEVKRLRIILREHGIDDGYA